MSDEFYGLFFIACIALVLLIVDRKVRIDPYLTLEGFVWGGAPQRCGTDLPPCPFPKRCMNGFCRGTEKPQLYERNPLPVVP